MYVDYTGTPPQESRFRLIGPDTSDIHITLPFDEPRTYSIYVNDKEVCETEWDETIGARGVLTGKDCCGEHRNIPVENKLEFVLRGNCEIIIKPKDEIRATVRLDWTLDEFYADGGVTTFVDRLAGALGIHASTIKVARVYEGSVVVEV